MVYVLSKEGEPLIPTKRHGKVRHLLKQGKAKVIKKMPFTPSDKGFRNEGQITVMRWFIYNSIKELYPNTSLTYKCRC